MRALSVVEAGEEQGNAERAGAHQYQAEPRVARQEAAAHTQHRQDHAAHDGQQYLAFVTPAVEQVRGQTQQEAADHADDVRPQDGAEATSFTHMNLFHYSFSGG